MEDAKACLPSKRVEFGVLPLWEKLYGKKVILIEICAFLTRASTKLFFPTAINCGLEVWILSERIFREFSL